MVKPSSGHDPLLRRPFSVFQVLRDSQGGATGISLLNKRIGVSTRASVRGAARRSHRVPRSARPSVHGRRSADRSLDGRRRRRPRAVCDARRAPPRGAASGRRSSMAPDAPPNFSTSISFAISASSWSLTTEDGSLGEAGPHHRAARQPPRGARRSRARDDLCVRAGRHAGRLREDRRAPRPAVPGVGRAHHGMRHGRLLQLRRADARTSTAFHHVRSCLAGPVLAGDQILWE